jgi:hypothetical protein
VHFAFGSWLGASGPQGYIDTQSGYQCQGVANSKEGEPPTNIAISGSTNVIVDSCTFSHLGAVCACFSVCVCACVCVRVRVCVCVF